MVNYNMLLMLAADSPNELRVCDVYRVMDQAQNLGELDGFKTWLLGKTEDHPDRDRLVREINEVYDELKA